MGIRDWRWEPAGVRLSDMLPDAAVRAGPGPSGSDEAGRAPSPARTIPVVRGDTGASGLLVLCGGGVIATFILVAALFVSGSLTHSRVDSSADMAALAVAGQILVLEDPCTAGQEAAARNGAQLMDCVVDGPTAVVRVSEPLPAGLRWILGRGTAEARARAQLVPAT